MLLVIILLLVLTMQGKIAPEQQLQALVHPCLQMQVYITLWSPLQGMSVFNRRIRLSLKDEIILELVSTVSAVLSLLQCKYTIILLCPSMAPCITIFHLYIYIYIYYYSTQTYL